jgi:hypothetical protein
MDEAVEDGVGVGRVADEGVPLVDRELAGDEGGTAAISVLQDLQEVVAGAVIERGETPVVEDQQIDAAERAQEARVAAVAAGERQIVEQTRDALVEDGAIVAAGLVAEPRGDPALADAGRAADQQVGVVVDPEALDELGEQRAVETAWGAVVDVFDASLLAQLGVRSRRSTRPCRRSTPAPTS